MTAIFKKELRLYFSTMTGYIFLFFLVLLVSIFFAFNNVLSLSPDFGGVLSSMVVVLLILAPVLTMRLFAEEARQKTDQLLFTSPLSTLQIVAGKFLAACAMLLIAMLVVAILPLLLTPYGKLPWAEIVTQYVGFYLLGCAFISVGIFISSLTENQIVAAVASFAALFLMYLMDGIANGMPASRTASLVFAGLLAVILTFVLYSSTRNVPITVAGLTISLAVCALVYLVNEQMYDGLIVKALQWVSIAGRYASFARGVINLADVAYYLSFCAAFVYLTVNKLEKRRWS